MFDAIGWPAAIASLALIALSVGCAWAVGLRIGREVLIASARAAVQLLIVGLAFNFMFESGAAELWAWLWIVAMVVVAWRVVVRRAGDAAKDLGLATAATIAGSTAVSLGVVFGFGVIDYEPVAIVVVSGITIGNAVPVAVLGVNQSVDLCRNRAGEIEAALAVGFDRRQVVRFFGPDVARSALVPQIERTKVVGIVALPGAMTGLLLAGVDPVEAVVIQLLVMYLVLGTAAMCVVTVVTMVLRSALTRELATADWVRRRRF